MAHKGHTIMRSSDYGQPPFSGVMRYCVRCCIPETEEGTTFDELGVCQACRSSEQKMHINWTERRKQLESILSEARRNAKDNYDCIVPISGGKDSVFQLHVICNVYKLRVLAVTHNQNWHSETGFYNLVNALETFNVDHIMFTPNRSFVNRSAKRSLEMIGDPCWHCHAGGGAFPIQIAVKYKIPLLVYGEGAAEGHGRSSYLKPLEFDRDYFMKVSAKKQPEQMICETISARDVFPYHLPNLEDCVSVGVRGIHLGNYIFWDDERQTEFVKKYYGWRETEIEQTYKRYKSAECIMPGLHDFTCYLKRGYARGTFHANIDVRNGLLSRDEGFELARKCDSTRPEVLDYFLKATEMTEEEFYQTMERHRKKPLQGIKIPVLNKDRQSSEKIEPYIEKFIRRLRPPASRHDGKMLSRAMKQSILINKLSFRTMPISAIHKALSSQELSIHDIALHCREQIELLDPFAKAWIAVKPDIMLQQATLLDQRIADGKPLRLLEGIPIGIKDVFNTMDFPTQMGSPLWAGFTPGNDARTVFYLKEEGALFPGKTVSAEFAVHALGMTINPYAPDRTPGTSSSGSAVAVALGMVPAALGTQTAASIVRPASFCGVYGCKPSFGLIPRTGVLKTNDSLDTIGFFTAWFEDLQALFDALRVKGNNYPISDAAIKNQNRQSKPSNRPWHVAFIKTHTWQHAEHYAHEALRKWCISLTTNGLDIELDETTLPTGMDESHELHSTIYHKSLSYYFQEEYKHIEQLSPIMNEIITIGGKISSAQFQDALRRQEQLAFAMDDFFQDYDCIICLSTAGAAPLRHECERPDPGLMWTLTYLPVISAPRFISPEGLPFGLQVVARRYNDPLLFKFCDYLISQGLLPANSIHPIQQHETHK